MQTKIEVLVGRHPSSGRHTARVRRAILSDLGDRLIRKEALAADGQWMAIAEGGMFPDNCVFEVTILEYAYTI